MGTPQSRPNPTYSYPIYVSVRHGYEASFPPPGDHRLFAPGTMTLGEIGYSNELDTWLRRHHHLDSGLVIAAAVPLMIPPALPAPGQPPGAPDVDANPYPVVVLGTATYGNNRTDITIQSLCTAAGPGACVGITLVPPPT